MSYRYRGLDANGGRVDGRVSASDRVDAQRQLEAQAIAPYELVADDGRTRRYERKRARPQDRQRFMRQLAVLLKAGMPLLSAFEIMEAEEPCRDLALAADGIRRDLRSGNRLSIAFSTHLPEFPTYAPRLIELGEATGDISTSLADIAQQMEDELRAASEVRNALAYPSFLAVAGVVAILFIFLFVVPRFAALLGDDRSNLPAFSRWVIESGVFLRDNLVQSLAVLGGVVVVTAALLRDRSARDSLADALMSAPLIGAFLRSNEIARWSRICGTALSGGAPLLDAMRLAEASVRSRSRRKSLEEARRAIRSGESLDEALKKFTDFDAMTVNLIRTGRMSSSLDEMMLFVADTYEADARNRAKRLTSLAEPLAIAFIASVVGVIVVSLVMAMTSLYDVGI